MDKPTKIFTICFTLMILMLGFFSPAWSGKGDIDLKIQGQILSANLEEIALQAILEKLEREKGIWFEADKSLLEEKVSVQFKDLSMEDGLQRILSRMNYSLMFDKSGKVVGIIVLGRSITGQGREATPLVGSKQPLSSEELEGDAAGGSFEIVPNSPPPGNPSPKPIDMSVVRNSPPPENPNVAPLDTTIVKDSPPPGNPSAKPIDTTIIKNAPPPDH